MSCKLLYLRRRDFNNYENLAWDDLRLETSPLEGRRGYRIGKSRRPLTFPALTAARGPGRFQLSHQPQLIREPAQAWRPVLATPHDTLQADRDRALASSQS